MGGKGGGRGKKTQAPSEAGIAAVALVGDPSPNALAHWVLHGLDVARMRPMALSARITVERCGHLLTSAHGALEQMKMW